MKVQEATQGIRLADIVAGLSLISDLGFGLPPGQAMRSCLIATGLARGLRLSEAEVADAFYASLLVHIGCVSMSHETSVLFGDELVLTRAVAMTDLGDPDDFSKTLVPELSRGLDPETSEALGAIVITRGPSFGRLYDTASGEVGRRTAQRIGLPVSTQETVFQLAESWQGDGSPSGLKGDEIALPARIVRAAGDAAFFDEIGDRRLAVNALKKRSGGTLDPAVVEAFVADASALLEEANAPDPRARILEVEPQPAIFVDAKQIVNVTAAYADAADLKSPFMHHHSSKVTALSISAAERGGFDAATVEKLRIAALLHDVGRVAISDVIWEKPGPLTTSEWEAVRMHPYHSERILAMSHTLAPVAGIAGMHREAPNGSGYHRGSKGSDIPMPARILSVSDAFVAMTEDRPYRPAFEPDEAGRRLSSDARHGKFDPDAVAVVLGAAGGTRPASASLRPAGLSEREVEVLRLIARGYSNPDIAETLSISRRTAEHHVQHIYTKIGASTRPSAALFASEHHLLD